MIISTPTMSRNAVAMRANSEGGIFRTSCQSTYSSAAPITPRTERTAGDCRDSAMENCAI